MKVIAEITLLPVGAGVSMSEHLSHCQRIFEEEGLKTELHANGTNLEGEWDDVVSALKRCHRLVHTLGVPRISTNLKLETRVDRDQELEEKVQSVEEKLEVHRSGK